MIDEIHCDWYDTKRSSKWREKENIIGKIRKANPITKSALKWRVGVIYLKKHLGSRITGARLQSTSASSATRSARKWQDQVERIRWTSCQCASGAWLWTHTVRKNESISFNMLKNPISVQSCMLFCRLISQNSRYKCETHHCRLGKANLRTRMLLLMMMKNHMFTKSAFLSMWHSLTS